MRVSIKEWNRGVSAPIFWDGIKVTYIRSFHPGYGGYGTIISRALWSYLYKEMPKYDLVHLHGAWNTFNLTAGVVARLRNVPYVVQLHNTFPIRFQRTIPKRVFHLLVRGPWLNGASAIIAFTPDEREEYLLSRAQDVNKTHIVPAIMPAVEWRERGRFRREWGVAGNECLILYLGRLHGGKGLEHLLEALSLLRGQKIRLAIVGPDAGYEARLRKEVQKHALMDQVLFTGPIFGEKKFFAYSDADVFVLPSMFEQLPVSALEAALCEVPLILSDRCGMTEMVTEAEAGIIVPYGSPQALAEAIGALCDDPQRRRQMGQNARAMVEKYCDPEKVIDALEAVYMKVCSRPRSEALEKQHDEA